MSLFGVKDNFSRWPGNRVYAIRSSSFFVLRFIIWLFKVRTAVSMKALMIVVEACVMENPLHCVIPLNSAF